MRCSAVIPIGLFRSVFCVWLSITLSACGGSSSSTDPRSTPVAETPTVTPSPEPTSIQRPEPVNNGVTLSGRITYDYVPHTEGGGLDYSAMETRPVRGASVYILDENGGLMAFVATDENGDYSAQVVPDARIKVRVRAELYADGIPSWVIRVTDNTQSNALYIMEGSLATSGSSNSVRDLHAPSGWNGLTYGDTRVAAPFAIIDAVYEALTHLLLADPALQLPPTELRWSTENIPISGARADGNIGTSFYDPSEDAMYILGHVNDDTDEYDSAVILHEFAHYIEDVLSRTDSIGGRHTLNGAFDMRLAFSEGLANGFAGFVNGRGIYADSSGSQQGSGYEFSLEDNNIGNPGWFNENSVGKIIYDLADPANESVDNLALGLSPILNTLRANEYRQSDAMTSIFLFSDVFNHLNPQDAQMGLALLMQEEEISGRGKYGQGETNTSNHNISSALPVYVSLGVGNTVNVCGNNRAGEYNGLDVRRFLSISIDTEATYHFDLVTTLGTGEKDPDAVLLRNGKTVALFNSEKANRENQSVRLTPGNYILEVYERQNVVDLVEGDGGSACFDVSLR